MADFRPLQGLRYRPEAAGDLGNLVAPPFDVISAEAQLALHDRSPYNVVRLEYGLDANAARLNRYQRAAATLAAWRSEGILQHDDSACFYLYEQAFTREGRHYRRTSIVGRLRLEPWEAGVVLPHEQTMSGPKQDRLRLLRACRTNVSPVFSLYRSDDGEALGLCQAAAGPMIADAVDGSGGRHSLRRIDAPRAIEQLQSHFRGRTLYIADGHHRYETALTYRDERQAAEARWSGEEPENFVLMALTAADDAGLVILPFHRLVRPKRVAGALLPALEEAFEVSTVQPAGIAATAAQLVEALSPAAALNARIVALGIDGGPPLLLRLRDRKAAEKLMPRKHSEAWRRLDVNVLQYAILQHILGIDLEAVREGGFVEFTESADAAVAAVSSGAAPLAFLVNPTAPEEIFAVADAGERMPQKSTYFYPKLGTGLVLYAFDASPVAEAPAL